MASSAKTYNEVDCKQQLLYIEIKKGGFGGHRQDLLVNILSEVEIDFYICTKCNGLLRNACIVGAEQNLACEMCVVEGETSLPMIKSRKKIPELGAKCPLVSRGCVWKGIIGEVDAHLDECNELVVNCSNKCSVILKRSELANHCENECLNRKVNCIHCKIVFQYKEIDNHFTTCPELPLLCLNECMETLLRKEMNSHIEKDCPNTIVLCTNGCGLKMKRRKLSIHCENECRHRIINCEYCGATLRHNEMENHYKLCLEFTLFCPNECQRSLLRKELESHIKEECPNTLVACPYKEIGCDVSTKRSEIQQHDKLFESNHLKITVIYYSGKVKSMETLFKDKENLLTSKVETAEAQMREKERDNEQLKSQLLNLTKINSELLDENATLKKRWSDELYRETKHDAKPIQPISKTIWEVRIRITSNYSIKCS